MTRARKPQPKRLPKSLGRIDTALWDRVRRHTARIGRYTYAWVEEALREKLEREEKDY
jgi:hypothetical protein